MATQAQILANRRNAGKSTGPQTTHGKALAAQNALRHGLAAQRNVLPSESQPEFDLHARRILDEIDPQTHIESILAERLVCLSWRLRRAVRIQNQAVQALLERNTPGPLAALARALTPKSLQPPTTPQSPAEDHLALGRASIRDLSNARVIERLLMHERRIENSLFKTLEHLQRLNLIRNLNLLNPTKGQKSPHAPIPQKKL